MPISAVKRDMTRPLGLASNHASGAWTRRAIVSRWKLREACTEPTDHTMDVASITTIWPPARLRKVRRKKSFDAPESLADDDHTEST